MPPFRVPNEILWVRDTYGSLVHVREAKLDDVDYFVEINSSLFHETIEESKNILTTCLYSKDRKQYMAYIDHQFIGICTLFYSEKKVMIYGLGIAESFQGQGYGLDLIKLMISKLKDQNCELELEVDSLNEKAYNLYKKVGFKEIKTISYFENELALLPTYAATIQLSN